ncbi:MAG TPA: GNAT family protein [Caulobacterales bacterium]|nr:GNAT family protein [Caulobacterales bacterium]
MELAAATLTHKIVRLEPFEEHHRDGLIAAAADPAIWAHIPFPVERVGYGAWFDWLTAERAAGRWIPHAVLLPDGRIVGQTCYLNIRSNEAGVEIGGTWYAPEVQGGAVNPACKLLMLEHAFACGAERVELKTDALNARSRAAILKLGATFEGVHRKHMRRKDGSLRDTAWYSILREEWPAVRARLEQRLAAFT